MQINSIHTLKPCLPGRSSEVQNTNMENAFELRGHNLRHFSQGSNQFQFVTATSWCRILQAQNGSKLFYLSRDKEDVPGQPWHIYIPSAMVQGTLGISHKSVFIIRNFFGSSSVHIAVNTMWCRWCMWMFFSIKTCWDILTIALTWKHF